MCVFLSELTVYQSYKLCAADMLFSNKHNKFK